jgi:hypothetical protein
MNARQRAAPLRLLQMQKGNTMNLVPYEQIAANAGISLRTVIRDVQRRLLTSHRLGGKVWIDADAAAGYIASRRAVKALRRQP